MLTRLWSFLTGYVSLIVEGKSLEKLINMAVGRGLYLWDVKWIDPERASVKVRLNGIRALRHIARRTRSRFRIAGKGGLPFGVARVRKRKLLLAGVALSVFIVCMMSSFIWFVEVKGNKKIPAEKIISVAEDGGLAMGTFKLGLNREQIEKYIRSQVPEVAWVGIRVTGTKAIIEVAEKIILPPVHNEPANVVAEKPGMVQELLVLNGKAAVSEGDMVKQGDVLITGIIRPDPKPEEAGAPGQEGNIEQPRPVKIVRARGIVRAKVWYDGYGECRLIEQGTRRTGRHIERLSVTLFGKELILKGPKTVPYREYVTAVETKNLPAWRNIRIPVELVTTDYYEVAGYRDIINVSDAYSIAGKRALALARSRIPSDAKVVREAVEEIQARGSNVIRVKAILEVIEDIGSVEPLKTGDIQQPEQENANKPQQGYTALN